MGYDAETASISDGPNCPCHTTDLASASVRNVTCDTILEGRYVTIQKMAPIPQRTYNWGVVELDVLTVDLESMLSQ